MLNKSTILLEIQARVVQKGFFLLPSSLPRANSSTVERKSLKNLTPILNNLLHNTSPQNSGKIGAIRFVQNDHTQGPHEI